jgi:glycosyltransferase involved in cell wall biosynthesis
LKTSLIILTTHFGTNFSGGSTATCEIFSRLENKFTKIIVVGTELGNHPFNNLEFHKYKNWCHAIKILKSFKRMDTSIFYGDFYNSFLFILAKIQFYFTYHDNWPELENQGVSNSIQSLFYTNIYRKIYKKARLTITVSKFKLHFIRKYTNKAELIYNGFNQEISDMTTNSNFVGKKIIMVGNIDKRKYAFALKLFEKITVDNEMLIDIYGNITDSKMANQLNAYTFVNLKGFVELIPYGSYKFLLHTSAMENLPIVFCEAIHNNLPVIAFDVGGSDEIIDKNNGVLIPPYDLSKMEKTIADVMNGSINLQPSLDLLEKHSWENASREYAKRMAV